MIYTRKRNINEKYNKIFNNLSNNSSKDSSKIYYSVSNKSYQSIDKNKSINKKNVFANNNNINNAIKILWLFKILVDIRKKVCFFIKIKITKQMLIAIIISTVNIFDVFLFLILLLV